MAKPHKCPVCDGEGQVIPAPPKTCPACDGTGIVWESRRIKARQEWPLQKSSEPLRVHPDLDRMILG